MQLPGSVRREVIEDLLDINIFTKMNQLLKEKSALLREQLGQANHDMEMVKEKIAMQQKHIADLKAKDAEHSQKNREKIAELEQQILDITAADAILGRGLTEAHKEATDKMAKVHDRNHTLHAYSIQIDKNIKAASKEVSFYESNDQCPTCAQSIDIDFKTNRVHTCRSRIDELTSGREKLVAELARVSEETKEISAVLKECTEKQNQIRANILTIRSLKKQMDDLATEMNSAQSEDVTDIGRAHV